MPTLDVYLQTARKHAAVNLHSWDLAGDIRDIKGELVSPGLFHFALDLSTPDLRNVSFKFWFPGEIPTWEPDDYTRTIPAKSAAQVWTTEFSPRCLLTDPRSIPALPAGTVLSFGVLTSKYAGGKLYAWKRRG
jgi:hypothetical protein